ncbi:MAG: N-acetylmuramoyl-L-alanine amidase-like domain-containing protein [Bacteroidota bacterium]
MMRRKNIYSTLLLLFCFSTIYSQVIYTQQDVEICNSRFELAVSKNLADKQINEIIIEIGKSFLGTDYVPNSLEKGEKEQLVIHLTGLDCYTFLESTLVLARCIKLGKTTFEDFRDELQNIRYRDGVLKEYPSRLHYFSDWIYDMNKRNIGRDITKQIGGVPYKKQIDFMRKHIDSYKQLKENPMYVLEIASIEKKISKRKKYYIPLGKIERLESKIESGDIIGITTNIEGLDIAHTGIAIRMDDGRIHLLHAPNVGNKVQISEKPLAEYLKANKKQTGIMILRPL